MVLSRALVCAAALAASASGEIYFKEQFNDDAWSTRWVQSVLKPEGERGAFVQTTGKWMEDLTDKAIKTSQDARFYGLSAKMDKTLKNEGKDLVVQFSVKHEQKIDCGGAYIKLLPKGLDQEEFGGDSTYSIMFGPDICGSGTKKTHTILSYEKEGELKNLENSKRITAEADQLTHLYTMIIKADNTYQVRIDGEQVEEGSLEEDWEFLAEPEIQDPEQSQPADWVTEKMIPDASDAKPEGYDDTPAQIPDPEAEKPDDWDDEDDGDWEAPMIDNPDYEGEWQQKMIANPDYKGPWEHPMIPNPAYAKDPNLHARCSECDYVGFELWQVKSGTLFDDIIVTDSVEEAEAFAEETWAKKVEGEKALFEAEEEKAREEKEAAEEAARAAAEAEEDEEEDEEDYEEDDEEEEMEDDEEEEMEDDEEEEMEDEEEGEEVHDEL